MELSILGEYGIDYKDGLARCVNDEMLYRRILSMFTSDTAFSEAKEALESGDYETAFDAFHELKGACANIALAEFVNEISPLVESMRTEDSDRSNLPQQMKRAQAAYDKAVMGIKLCLSE